MDQARASYRRALWTTALIGVLVLTGVTAIAFRADAARDNARDRETRAQVVGALQVITQGLDDRATDVAGLFRASRSVQQEEFRRFTGPIVNRTRANGVAWLQHVTRAQRPAFARALGVPIVRAGPGGRLVPDPVADDAFVVRYVTLGEPRRTVLGVNPFAEPVRRAT